MTTATLAAEQLRPFPSDMAETLQSVIDQQSPLADFPGLSCAVSIPGYETWKGTYGFSDTEKGTPTRSDMIFGMGSISKTFTATLIMQLADEGALDLDDPIGDYLPLYEHVDPSVSIFQLLHMSSGIFDFLGSPELGAALAADPTRLWEPEEIISTFLQPMRFAPGSRQEYSNTNYILLGLIVEQASGESYENALRRRLFEPLSLDHTFIGVQEPGSVSFAYTDFDDDGIISSNGDGALLPTIMAVAWAAGGILSTPEDVNTFAQALFGGDLVSEESLSEMLDWGLLPIFELASGPVYYGLGVIRFNIGGKELIGHGGEIGYYSIMHYLRESGIAISFMANTDDDDTESATQPIDALLQALLERPLEQELSFAPIPYPLVGDTPIELEASTPVSSIGLPIRYEIIEGPALIENGRLILTGEGSVALKAIQDATDFYQEAFSEQTFIAIPPDGDEDRDGVSNIVESLFGMDIHKSDAHSLPQIRLMGNEAQFAFVKNRTDMRYILESSADLSVWTEEATTEQSDDSAAGMAKYIFPPNGNRFLRLRVEKRENGE